MKMVNFSNHKSSMWSDKQKGNYNIVDIAFPNVPPMATAEELDDMALEYVNKILNHNPQVVMAQGEMTLIFRVVNLLKAQGIKCVASCSDRKVKETVLEDGTTKKESIFEFVQFREY